MSPRELHLWTISSEEPSISNLYQERWLIDFLSVSQRIFCASGFAVPNGEKNVAAVHDLLIPCLKRLQYHFAPKFCPIRKKLEVSYPKCLRCLKSERINPTGAACNDLGYFSAAQAVPQAEGAKVLILHPEVRDEVKFRN